MKGQRDSIKDDPDPEGTSWRKYSVIESQEPSSNRNMSEKKEINGRMNGMKSLRHEILTNGRSQNPSKGGLKDSSLRLEDQNASR